MVDCQGRNYGEELKVAYTNVNELLSAQVELNDYLWESTPDMIGISETKLSDGIHVIIGNGKYHMWKTDRKEKQDRSDDTSEKRLSCR